MAKFHKVKAKTLYMLKAVGNRAGTNADWVDVTSIISGINSFASLTASISELNIMDGVTATKSELNIMDGVTANTSEINILDGVTATTSELNILDGVTATTSELNILDGVTATTAELANACDVSARTRTRAAAGADTVPVGIQTYEFNHASAIAATIADSTNHQGLFIVKQLAPAGDAGHALTLTSGTFDGSNNVATCNAVNDALVVYFDSAGNGTIIENVGSVALS